MNFTRPLPRLELPWLARVAVFCGAALALSGCGNDPHPAPLHEKRADGSPWVVRYAYMPDEIRSLDPQFAYDQVSRMILEPVQDTLLEYDPMQTDPYRVEPCLLQSMPEKTENPDGSVVYLCRLKPNVLFHDDPCFPGGQGREVVAADVHYAFQRICDPAVECPVLANLAEYVDGMTSVSDAAQKAGRLDYDHQPLAGVEVLDAHTFKLHLVKSYPQIVYWLAMHFTAPVAREAVEYYDGKQHPDEAGLRPLFKFHPVGNGPFKIAEWVRGQRYRLVRNEKYHTTVFPSGGWPPEREQVNRPLAGHTLPLVDEVQYTVFHEILPVFLLTRQGYLDRMGVMKDAVNSAITSSSELAPKFKKRGMKLERALEVSTFFIVFNMQDPVVGGNKKLRQALSCAYNAKGYVDMLYGGVAPVAQQLIPPGIFGYDKDFKNPYGTDVEKARRLIAEAGYPNGIDPKTNRPLVLTMDTVATGGEERQLAEYEQRQFEQLGIEVKVVEDTFARQQEKEDEGNFQISDGSGWGADYPDAENFFFLFSSGNFPPRGKNVGRYKNPEFDKLFDRMSTMEDSPARLELIRKMNDVLIEDCPILLAFNKGYYVISQPWAPLTHLNLLLEGGLKYLPINERMRAEKRREWNPVPKWPLGAGAALFLAALAYAIHINRRRNA